MKRSKLKNKGKRIKNIPAANNFKNNAIMLGIQIDILNWNNSRTSIQEMKVNLFG